MFTKAAKVMLCSKKHSSCRLDRAAKRRTRYFGRGRVVYGAICIKDSENVTVEGRGMLDCLPYRRGNDTHRTEENSVVQNALKNWELSDVDCCYLGIVTV